MILLDIRMPGGPNGVEVALKLKELAETKNMKVVFLSGVDDPWPAFAGTKQEVSQELGATDFFVKTGDLSDLIEKVRGVLKQG